MTTFPPRELVLGTRNAKKAGELRELLEPQGFRLITLADLPESIEVDETGGSFQENAQLKAIEQARHLGRWVLGEDSGLSVDALNGAPGIYSARFAGPTAKDPDNNALLLEKLSGIPDERRTAHYTCHMSLSDPDGKVWIDTEGYCCGRILRTPSGAGGFGYDPLFEIPEYHQTFGQLGPAVKSMLSHRARAARLLLRQLLSASGQAS